MLTPINYLFYKMYIICKKIELNSLAFKSVNFFYLFCGLWVASVLRVLLIIKQVTFDTDENALILAIIPYGLILLYFLYRERYIKMIDKFKDETNLMSTLGWIYFGIFTLGGLVFFLITMTTPLPD